MVGRLFRVGLVALLLLGAGACTGLLKTRSGPEQPRIAVLEIEGAESPRARELVIEMVAADQYEVVGPRAYDFMAHRRRATKKSDADVATVAKSLRLSAVVYGKMVRLKGPRRRLVVVVRDGMSGAVIDRVAVILRRGELRERQRRKLSTRLYLALDEIVVSHEAMVAQKEKEEAERRAREEEERRQEAEARARAEEEKRLAAEKAREEEEKRREAEARVQAERERERERARQRALAAKAEREREERERKEARQAKKAADEAEEEPSEPLDLETDDSGQVIDDEMPDVLKR